MQQDSEPTFFKPHQNTKEDRAGTDLETAAPEEIRELYLDHREEDASYATRKTIEKGLMWFYTWLNNYGITDLNDLTGRDLLAFKNWRKKQDIKKITLNGTLAVVRRFLKFCVDIEAVSEDLPGKVPDTPLSDDDEVRKDPPLKEEVDGVEDYLNKYRYASRQHVYFAIIREYGIRQGAVRSLDKSDYDSQEMSLQFLHHSSDSPDKRGTPLKNNLDSQRALNVPADLNELLIDFINNPNRPEGTDEFDRRPLFTTVDNQGNVGRLGINRIREDFYKISRPCVYDDDCPLDRDHALCEGAKNRLAYKCPENWTPHRLRTFAIMEQLGDGMPYELVSERADVSVPVLKKHYDHRSMERKRDHRLEKVQKHREGYADNPAPTKTQTDIDDWSKVGIPALGLLFVIKSILSTTLNRLKKELGALSAGPKNSIRFEKDKVVKAAVMYPLFVILLAINFNLLLI